MMRSGAGTPGLYPDGTSTVTGRSPPITGMPPVPVLELALALLLLALVWLLVLAPALPPAPVPVEGLGEEQAAVRRSGTAAARAKRIVSSTTARARRRFTGRTRTSRPSRT